MAYDMHNPGAYLERLKREQAIMERHPATKMMKNRNAMMERNFGGGGDTASQVMGFGRHSRPVTPFGNDGASVAGSARPSSRASSRRSVRSSILMDKLKALESELEQERAARSTLEGFLVEKGLMPAGLPPRPASVAAMRSAKAEEAEDEEQEN
eukprot:CAMPEP_0183796814 /NCGR_PEP_ID=MMETSP0803_2-20130417/12979_1 /TAXON_ID=195967 /ORGANISM="Crustomastix stigmata, Strain CCMP3273" /LENGTH=153 /DNA_ID=CAMNT_0026041471 /DNA_START=33 /DNA_END=494 /DNA_ORIENTATION=+